jgi:hypothetical protein
MTEPLRLKALDAEDLGAIAVVTQDALAPLSDMAWLPDERRFVIALNRFRWEMDGMGEADVYERVNCGLRFEHVSRVQVRGIDLKQRDFILDLLTITAGEGCVLLRFAGNRDVKLTIDRLECRLDDFGEPWPTKTMPQHAAEAAWAEWEQELSQS